MIKRDQQQHQYERQARDSSEFEEVSSSHNETGHHLSESEHHLHHPQTASLHDYQSERHMQREHHGQMSNTLFKNKKPVDYQVINTQRSIPSLEHSIKYDFIQREYNHLLSQDLANKGLGLTHLKQYPTEISPMSLAQGQYFDKADGLYGPQPLSHPIEPLRSTEAHHHGPLPRVYEAPHEAVALESMPMKPKLERNGYADMLIANTYIENLHGGRNSAFTNDSKEGLIQSLKNKQFYPGTLADKLEQERKAMPV